MYAILCWFILSSVHLLHAGLLCVDKGADALLKLQEFCCWGHSKGKNYLFSKHLDAWFCKCSSAVRHWDSKESRSWRRIWTHRGVSCQWNPSGEMSSPSSSSTTFLGISHNTNKNIPSSGEKPEQAQVCQTSRPKPRGKKVDKSSAQLTKSSNTENSQPKKYFQRYITVLLCPKGQ